MDETPVATTTAKPVAAPKTSPKPAVKKPVKRAVDKGEQRPYMQATIADDARPMHRLAFELLAVRSDLLPSVERIINGCPDDDTTERALQLFRTSLVHVGDPHRDPAVAIAAAVSGERAV